MARWISGREDAPRNGGAAGPACLRDGEVTWAPAGTDCALACEERPAGGRDIGRRPGARGGGDNGPCGAVCVAACPMGPMGMLTMASMPWIASTLGEVGVALITLQTAPVCSLGLLSALRAGPCCPPTC